MLNNMFLKAAAISTLVALCVAEPPSNAYLPPHQGYNYQTPPTPFRTPTTIPTQPPTPPPTPPPRRPIVPPQTPVQNNLNLDSYGPTVEDTLSDQNKGGNSFERPTQPNTGSSHTYETEHLNKPHVPGMPFDFNYAVKDDYYGTDYSHNAISDGDVVRGEYRVQLPDGRTQIVKYTADWATGFHADVTYEGEARYPEASSGYPQAAKPQYGPPQYTPQGGGY